MKKIRPWIVFTLFQFASVGTVWLISTPEQQAEYLAWFGIGTPQETPLERTPLNIGDIPYRSARHEIDPVYQCAPQTRSIKAVKESGVYRWVDETGETHFSDKPPGNVQAENLTKQYASREQYFTIKVTNRGKALPAYMQDHLATDTRQIYSVLSNQLKVSQLRQVDLNVNVFDNKNNFKQFHRKVAPSLVSDNIAGFYSPSLNLVAIMRQRNDDSTFATARHEATHVIIAGLFGNIPTWFTEGMAEYFEQMSISGQLKTIAPNSYWLNLLRRQQRSRHLMSLNEYFQYDRKSWRAKDQDTMYATAWSLIYFLMDSKNGQILLQQYMNELISDRCQTINSKAFFAKNYRGGLQKLDQDWQRWLARGRYASHRF